MNTSRIPLALLIALLAGLFGSAEARADSIQQRGVSVEVDGHTLYPNRVKRMNRAQAEVNRSERRMRDLRRAAAKLRARGDGGKQARARYAKLKKAHEGYQQKRRRALDEVQKNRAYLAKVKRTNLVFYGAETHSVRARLERLLLTKAKRGGTWHVYKDGERVRMSRKAPRFETPKAAKPPQADPGVFDRAGLVEIMKQILRRRRESGQSSTAPPRGPFGQASPARRPTGRRNPADFPFTPTR